jgi:hypothetical protein
MTAATQKCKQTAKFSLLAEPDRHGRSIDVTLANSGKPNFALRLGEPKMLSLRSESAWLCNWRCHVIPIITGVLSR